MKNVSLSNYCDKVFVINTFKTKFVTETDNIFRGSRNKNLLSNGKKIILGFEIYHNIFAAMF